LSLLIALTNPACLELFNEFFAVARGLLHYLLDDFFNEKFQFSAKEIFSKESVVNQPLIALDSALVKFQGS